MNCPQCQMPLPQDAQFCARCGYPVAQALSGQMPAVGAGSTGSQPTPTMPPAYQAPPSQPMYAPPMSQPMNPPPYQPPYQAAPSQPMYGPPPSQPMYAAPPSQPMYAAPPSQPMYGPPTGPIQVMGPAPISSRLGQMLRAAPPTAAPSNRIQAFMQRNVSAPMATNPWFMAVAGAVLALVCGLILTAIAEALWSAALDQALAVYATSALNQVASGMVKSLLAPDLLKFYLFEQHVPFTLHADISASGVGGGGDLGVTLPLTGLILIPGIALALGGYISSASDFTHNIRSSLLRGALIGPFYGVILAIIALVSGSSTQVSLLGEGVGFSLSASPISAFFYGLLWGALFGALGGWIQFAGRRAVSGILPTMRATRSRWLGAGAGGVVAIAAGILLTSALTAALYPLALTAQSGSAANTASVATSSTSASSAPLIALAILAFLPTVASVLFMFVAGAPYETTAAQSSLLGSSGSQTSPASSVGLIGAQSHPSFGPVYLVLLIPIICYLIGGRISARIAGATRTDTALVAGALISVPCGLLMAGIAYLLSFSLDVNALGLVSASEGAAPSIFGAFLAGLVGGAIFGALGGMSEIAAPRLGGLGHILLLPLRPLALAVDPLLDIITGHPRGQTRSAARRWLYDAALLAAVFVALVIILNVVNALPLTVIPYRVTLILDVVITALVVALPLLYLTGAIVTLFSAPLDDTPLASSALAASPLMQPPIMSDPMYGAPIAPYPSYPAYPGAAMGGYSGYPGAPGTPGPSGYPAYPAYPAYPGPTGSPVYPGPPSMPMPPVYPAYPAYPATPNAPGQPPAIAGGSNDETIAN